MPTVLTALGIRVAIHTDDHLPPHVHCFVGDGEIVVLLEPEVWKREQRGRVTAREARRVLDLVRKRRGLLLREWRRVRA